MNLTARAPLAQSRSRVCKMTDQTRKRKGRKEEKKTTRVRRSGLDTYLLHTVPAGARTLHGEPSTRFMWYACMGDELNA